MKQGVLGGIATYQCQRPAGGGMPDVYGAISTLNI